MSQVISLVAPPKAMTPARSSPMELDDHDPRAFRTTADTPESPSPRTISIARKRAASINTADASYARFEQLQLNTPGIMNSDSPRDHICLCTPAPKIPRPRNAFILYRQHHQAQVVAENPNLSNPEISKIIGEQWKEESEQVKDRWKSLADEEKQRHQRQYPDYRYQPRRGARAQATRPGSSPADDVGRCPKCNGRSLATPRTPSASFPTPTGAKPGIHPFTSTMRGDEPDMSRRSSFGSLPLSRPRYPAQRPSVYDVDEYDPGSPEMKRRRFNNNASYHPVTSPNLTPGQTPRALSLGGPPSSMRPYGAPTLPEPGGLTRSKSGPMPPPPRPPMSGSWPENSPHTGRHHSFDESLRLPPLQTSVPMSPTMATEVDIRQINTPVTGLGISATRDPQARSVEAMVMSISFTKKLAVLARICHPHSSPTPGEIESGTRGPVIAVEGPRPKLLKQVGKAVQKALMAVENFDLKSWENHSTQEFHGGDGFRSDSEGTPLESQDFFAAYFQTMARWHEKSKEIVKHIGPKQELKADDADKSPRRGSAESTSSNENQGNITSHKIPVALLKEGFSLTLSDMFACNAPIGDAYAPIDHWQWMATLWRGIVGPDLVIYVKPTLEEEISKCGAVQVQKRPALMIVRVPSGHDLDEATERRVAFEVVEWVRGA